MTVAQIRSGQRTGLHKAALVLGGTAAIALAAQISVPMYPVPMTLQTLAILMVGLTLGARLGAVTLLVYLAQGAMGLPVFANAGNGAAFFGPTAGFLIGFVGVAWAVGWAADRGLTRSVLGAALVCMVASVLLYIPGLAWPMAVANIVGLEGGWVGLSWGAMWQGFVAPFVMGDMVKAVLAAVVTTSAFAALRRRTR